MKCFIIIISLIVSLSFGDNWTFEEVCVVKDKTQEQLYNKAKEFIALNYKSANSVIQMDSKENGMIVKGGIKPIWSSTSSVYKTGSGLIYHTLKINFKNGKYKYIMNDFYHKGVKYSAGSLNNVKADCGSLGITKKQFSSMKEKHLKQVHNFLNEFTKFMSSKNNDDW